MVKKINKQSGFGVLEMLVVIAIVSLLATVVFVSQSSDKPRQRDLQRKNDLNNMMLSIEMYYQEHGYYPNPSFGDVCSSADGCWDTLAAELAPYISPLPKDPQNIDVGGYWSILSPDSHVYMYFHDVPGTPQKYDIIGNLENKGDSDRCQVKCFKSHVSGLGFCPGGGDYPPCEPAHPDFSNQLFSPRL